MAAGSGPNSQRTQAPQRRQGRGSAHKRQKATAASIKPPPPCLAAPASAASARWRAGGSLVDRSAPLLLHRPINESHENPRPFASKSGRLSSNQAGFASKSGRLPSKPRPTFASTQQQPPPLRCDKRLNTPPTRLRRHFNNPTTPFRYNKQVLHAAYTAVATRQGAIGESSEVPTACPAFNLSCCQVQNATPLLHRPTNESHDWQPGRQQESGTLGPSPFPPGQSPSGDLNNHNNPPPPQQAGIPRLNTPPEPPSSAYTATPRLLDPPSPF